MSVLHKRVLCLAVFILLIGIGSSWAADDESPYGLLDVYRIALERSEKIKLSEENLFIAEQTREKALAVLIPTLSAFGNYTHYSERKTTGPMDSLLQPYYHNSWGVRFDQTFTLNGKELKAYEMAKENILKSEEDLRSVKEDYLRWTSDAFFNVLRMRRALEIAKADVRRLQTHRDAVDKRVRFEVATKTDLYRAEAELSKSRADLARVANALKLAKAVLAGNLGLPADWRVIDENEKLISPIEIDLEEMKQRAAQNRPELKALKLQTGIAEKQIKLAEGDFWPTVSFEGVYRQYDQHPIGDAINRESAWLGFNVNFTLYDGGLRRASVREAEAWKRQADLMLADRIKQVNVEVENAYLDYITQTGIRKSRTDQLTFARENFTAVTKQFEHGLSNSVDIMDANTLLVTSEVELADVELRCGLAFITLKYTTGSLLSEVLDRLKKLKIEN